MAAESRTQKSLLNAKVNTACYFVALAVAFFTRKVFIDRLGIDFVGLTGALQSLLGFLNLAELGVSTAIAYVLYKPLFDGDRSRINEIISVFGFLYRCIGFVILGAGVLLSAFLPLIFADTPFSLPVIYFGFYAFLAASLLGYFVNYKITLLAADQRNYVVTGYFQLTTSAKVLIQMALALYFKNFILFFAIEILAGIANSIILNRKIAKTYPWLAAEVRLGRALFKKYPEIGKYIKQLFVHKIAGFVQFQITPMLVYAYVSLPVVGIYGNYTLICDRVRSFISGILDSTTAGVGNLISEGNRDKIISFYRELFSMRFCVAAIFTACIYVLISPFVRLWLGDSLVLPDLVVALVCLQFFLNVLRGTTDQFINGYGLFYDIWAPATETILFIVSAMTFGSLWGLPGVLMGPIVSTIVIIHIWKPIFLYTKGFRLGVWRYALLFVRNLLAAAIAIAAAFALGRLIGSALDGYGWHHSWFGWLFDAIVFTAIVTTLSLLTFSLLAPGFTTFLRRFVNKRLKSYRDL